MVSGIYQITHIESGKKYIGSALYFPRRFAQHRYDLKTLKHGNSKLQRAYNKYGPDAFTFESLEECPKDDLISREQMYLDIAVDWGFDYNLAAIAGNGNRLGTKHTDQTKQQISISKKGSIPWNKNIKTGVIPWNKGKTGVYSESVLKNMSEAHKGKPSWNKGKMGVYAVETIEKMSIAKLGRKQSQQEKDKRAKSLTKNRKALCHPELKHYALDKCLPCYNQFNGQRYREQKKKCPQ